MRAVAVAAALSAAHALTLQTSLLTVVLDDSFPRALNYTHSTTGETINGGLTGWGFHTAVEINKGQVVCGESGLSLSYTPLAVAGEAGSTDGRTWTLEGTCVVNWLDAASSPRQAGPALVTLNASGTITAQDDAAVSGAAALIWRLESATITPPLITLKSMDFIGLEALTFRAPPPTPGCMYTPDMNGASPSCPGDSYYVDAWSNDGIDEWWSATWDSSIQTGQVSMNALAGNNLHCFDGAASRRAPGGPWYSILAGGWSRTGKTGAMAMSTTAKHTPFWTGPRAHDTPGRCNVFTVIPASMWVSFACGSALPYEMRVGVFPDLTDNGGVDSDDLLLWRRMQFPRADVLYRTTLPYKLQVDNTAYTNQNDWGRITFAEVGQYLSNLSTIFDSYPQTSILVGWQGLGHDTLYPAWDLVNVRLGGQPELAALVASAAALSGNNLTSISYHVNADEAYSLYNGTANPEFDVSICRLQIDHVTPWFRNGSTGDQNPNYGMRCSISKTKDNVQYGRYARYARFFSTVPAGSVRTIHSDAWRDVGASWEPESAGGYIPCESEQFCGQAADSAFWRSHGVSMGVEGPDGQAQEFSGTVSYEYHVDGWDPAIWGRVIGGTSLGYDLDVYCNNPGGKCGWASYADSFYLSARIYQLALTDELLNSRAAAAREAAGSSSGSSSSGSGSSDGGSSGMEGHLRFRSGGRIAVAHTYGADGMRAHLASAGVSQPSSWPYGGDVIPIVDGAGGALLPLVMPDGATLHPSILHAYQASNGVGPDDPNCALFQSSPALYTAANNTRFDNWANPAWSFEMDPSLPELQVVAQCNATCWANATCAGWDMIKVTPNSGKLKPVCEVYAAPSGCGADPNQWAGVKAPLPVPTPGAGVNQVWTLPLSWVGGTVNATTLTPTGPVTGQPTVQVTGRKLQLLGVQPGYPVRLTLSS